MTDKDNSWKPDAVYTWIPPQIVCPRCHASVAALHVMEELVPLGTPELKAAAVAAKPPTKAVAKALRQVNRVYPCTCQVTSLWAEAYREEIDRRRHGLPGKDIRLVKIEELVAKKQMLLNEVGGLYAQLANAASPKAEKLIERNLVVKVDELLSLEPEIISHLKPVELSASTREWAEANGFVLPDNYFVLKASSAKSKPEKNSKSWSKKKVVPMSPGGYATPIEFMERDVVSNTFVKVGDVYCDEANRIYGVVTAVNVDEVPPRVSVLTVDERDVAFSDLAKNAKQGLKQLLTLMAANRVAEIEAEKLEQLNRQREEERQRLEKEKAWKLFQAQFKRRKSRILPPRHLS